MNNQNNVQKPKNTSNLIALICTISGIVVGVIGGICFGVIGAFIGLAAGVVGLIFAIKAKKETNGAAGQASFVMGIVAIALSVVFMLGCAAIGCSESSSTGTNYTCYGLCGGSCKAANDTAKVYKKYSSLF